MYRYKARSKTRIANTTAQRVLREIYERRIARTEAIYPACLSDRSKISDWDPQSEIFQQRLLDWLGLVRGVLSHP